MPFCTRCGMRMENSQYFCSHCGAPCQPDPNLKNPPRPSHIQAQPLPLPQRPAGIAGTLPAAAPASATFRTANAKIRNKKSGAGKVIALIAAGVLLFGLGAGVAYAGSSLGIWQGMALNGAADSWKNGKDVAKDQKEINKMLTALADKLEAGDVDGAMVYINPDRQQEMKKAFSEHGDQLPQLAKALRNTRLTFMSESGSTVYLAQRQAKLTMRYLDRDIPITIILINGKWVVDII